MEALRKMDVLGELCDLVAEMEGLHGVLEGLAELSADRLGRAAGSDIECLVILHMRKLPPAMAGSDERVIRLEGIETLLDDGPGLHAVRSGLPVIVNNAVDARWPGYGLKLAEQGFAGLVAVPLELGARATAVLVFFAADSGVLREPIVLEAMGLADEGRRALSTAVRVAEAELKSENLAAALEHRTAIDLARGILMAQDGCSAQEAFDMLCKASNNRNQKLHALAVEIISRFAPAPGPAHFEP